MPHTLILILVGSGCLLLRESGAEIYGTYSVFDHLGSYSEPNRSPSKNVTIIQKKASPFTKTLQISSSSQSNQPHVYGQQQSPHQPQQPVYQAATPLAIPQYEDSIARPFSDVPESAATGAASSSPSMSASSSTTTASPSTTQQTTAALQVTSGNPPPAQSQARVPLYVYNPGLARRLGLGTFMMGSVLYGLTLLPALLAVGATTGVGPFAGLMSSLSGSESRRRRRRKRSNPPPLVSSNAYKFREMPLLDNSSSYKFLSLVENTMEIRKIGESSCKKFYVCKIYQSALESSERPSPQDFEIAVIDTFGIAAERTGYKFDLISAVRYYLDAALVGLMRGNCSKIFPCAEPLFRFFPLWSDQRNKN